MRPLILFFVVYLAALTAPLVTPLRLIEPRVLGLPMAFAWVVLWVMLGWIALAWQYHADRQRDG